MIKLHPVKVLINQIHVVTNVRRWIESRDIIMVILQIEIIDHPCLKRKFIYGKVWLHESHEKLRDKLYSFGQSLATTQ